MNQIHVIDTDAQPFIPEGWTVETHKGIGRFEWKPGCFAEYLSEGQKRGTVIGNDLLKELEGKPALPATVLDYLLNHQELLAALPKEDEKGNIKCYFFCGTVYGDSEGDLYFPCLHWGLGGARWQWNGRRLDYGFASQDPVLLAAA